MCGSLNAALQDGISVIQKSYLSFSPHISLKEHGATGLGPAALASVAVASRYPGSKVSESEAVWKDSFTSMVRNGLQVLKFEMCDLQVILCTDGRANIGLGNVEDTPTVSSSFTSYFYKQLAQQAVGSG